MGKQYYIGEKDERMLVSLFEREIVSCEDSIHARREDLHWMVQSAKRAKHSAEQTVDPRLPHPELERLALNRDRDRLLRLVNDYVADIRELRAEINQMKLFGRRLGYDF